MDDKEKLSEILKDYDIPDLRREITLGNITWMMRNLAFRNKEKPDFEEAMKLIKKIYREKTYRK